MRIIAMAAALGGKRIDMLVPLPRIDRSFVETRRPNLEIINDPEKVPVSKTMIQMPKIEDSSLLIMPLIIGSRVLGHLFPVAEGKGKYADKHAKLFSLLNKPFVIAMSNTLGF